MFQMTLVSYFTINFVTDLCYFEKVDPFSSNGLLRLSYAAGVTMQIFIYCWFGNEVEVTVRKLLNRKFVVTVRVVLVFITIQVGCKSKPNINF